MFGARHVDRLRGQQQQHRRFVVAPGTDQLATRWPLVIQLPTWLAVLLVVAVALLPRVAGLNDFYTTDEAYFWQGRVDRFSDALENGNWAATNQTGHPGVTTMWLGALGQRLALARGLDPPAQGSGAAFLAHLRLPLAITNALAVGLGYLLLLRLLRPLTALLTALLWATSPFLVAHSRLLHLDALLASFMTLSLLFLLLATAPRPAGKRRTLALVASGLCAGLALLTKAPALLLLPVTGLVLLGAGLWGHPPGWHLLLATTRSAAVRMAIWLAVAAVVFAALWPAMWVGPQAAIGAVVEEVIDTGAQPHSSGNFFMGRPIDDPGWRFYIAVVAWRGEMLTLAGLVALLALATYRLSGISRRSSPGSGQAPGHSEPYVLTALALFAILFTLALTLLAKKFDRYLLPIWPSLQILGAIGLVALFRQLVQPATAAVKKLVLASMLPFALGIGLAQAAVLALYHPYYLSYYNPLLGGGAAAQGVLLTGWGEGMEQAGAWLGERPDLRRGAILSWLPTTLEPFVPPGVPVLDLDLETVVEPANYAVVYAGVAERDRQSIAEAYALQTAPLYTVRVHGITYATVHQLPRPFTTAVGAAFDGVHLRGYSHQFIGTTLVITPSWDVQADMPGGVFSFVHVLNEQGERVAQIDVLLDDGMFADWQIGQQFGSALPLDLPPNLPTGTYRVVIGLYTQLDGARLPLWHGQPLPEEVAGPHAISLLSFRLDQDRQPLVLSP